MKSCPKCNTQIPEECDICPNCKKEPETTNLPVFEEIPTAERMSKKETERKSSKVKINTKSFFKKIFLSIPLCFMLCIIGLIAFGIVNGIITTIKENNFEIDLPKTPLFCSSYDYSGDFESAYKITDITYEIRDDNLYLKFKGEKTDDVEGNNEVREIDILWQLKDSEGHIVASDEISSPKIKVGEKFAVESEDYSFNVDFDEDYQLIIKNTQNEETLNQYEDLFIGQWSNSEALLSFQYKDDVYCGGVVISDIDTDTFKLVVFEKYIATKDKLILHIENGKTKTFNYHFFDGCLYLNDSKFERFD
ncbi:MAG: hypothetical protein IJO09_08575 [Oscillospiraceae bacterium]|nr:hypothetical protein [Oscillospiraceae bacterium]